MLNTATLTALAKPTRLQIEPIKAFEDNYLWLLHDNTHAVVVDPGDSAPVEACLAALNLELVAILVTHHHADHTGGLAALLQARNIPVYGPHNPKITHINQRLSAGSRIALGKAGSLGTFEVFEVPGHTLDHIAFYSAAHGVLFCGDTLFSAGCGRLFEGSPAQMLQSLQQLASLPAATKVYCTHEYTLANLRFAASAEPVNNTREAYVVWCQAQRAAGLPTLPSNIGQERAINPFLRCNEPGLRAAVQANAGAAALENELDTFAALRQWKNNFK
jgi:hydroxyacylglutathione hydrolase